MHYSFYHSFIAMIVVIGAYNTGVTIINTVQETPYMDEVFHVHQTAQYCKGDWLSYHPDITTPPALYIFGVLFAYFISFMSNMPLIDTCNDATILRLTGSLFVCALLYVSVELVHELYPKLPRWKCLIRGVMLSLFPILYCSTLLYYTDTGALLFILTSYLASLNGHHAWAGLLGFVAVLFRQTSMVWVVCIASLAVVRVVSPISNGYMNFIANTWKNRGPLIRTLWPYFIVVIAFFSFVVYHGSIVLGHQQYHAATINLPQILYFCAIVVFCDDPFHLHPSLLTNSLLVPIAYCFVWMFTVVHPFILSDNRHYSFYLWRYMSRWNTILTPTYALCVSVVWGRMKPNNWIQSLQSWIILASICLVLCPTPLFELRYFIIPFFFVALHTPPNTLTTLLFTIVFVCVNAAYVYMFVNKVIVWGDGSRHRLML